MGAVREVVQRRPRQQPRQSRQPRDVDGAAVPRRRADGPRRRAGRSAGRATTRPASTARRMDELDSRRGAAGVPCRVVDAANELIARREPWKLAKAGDERALDARAVGRERGAARRGRAAVAVHAGVVRRDPAPSRRGARRRRRCVSTADAAWQAERRRAPFSRARLLWPRLEAAPADAATANVSTKETTCDRSTESDRAGAAAGVSRQPRPRRAAPPRRRGRSTRASRSTTS